MIARKNVGWIVLNGCLVAVIVAAFSSRSTMPQTAQAAASQAAQSPTVSPETTQACQTVANQIVLTQQIILNEKRSGQLKGLAQLDAIVAQEYQIDTSKCPTDFRMKVLRFIAAEDSARVHAHMDRTGKAENFAAALIASCVAPPTVVSSAKRITTYDQKIADEQKQDLANIQSTVLDLAQVAMKYGVK